VETWERVCKHVIPAIGSKSDAPAANCSSSSAPAATATPPRHRRRLPPPRVISDTDGDATPGCEPARDCPIAVAAARPPRGWRPTHPFPTLASAAGTREPPLTFLARAQDATRTAGAASVPPRAANEAICYHHSSTGLGAEWTQALTLVTVRCGGDGVARYGLAGGAGRGRDADGTLTLNPNPIQNPKLPDTSVAQQPFTQNASSHSPPHARIEPAGVARSRVSAASVITAQRRGGSES